VPHPFARSLGEWVGSHEIQRFKFMRSETRSREEHIPRRSRHQVPDRFKKNLLCFKRNSLCPIHSPVLWANGWDRTKFKGSNSCGQKPGAGKNTSLDDRGTRSLTASRRIFCASRGTLCAPSIRPLFGRMGGIARNSKVQIHAVRNLGPSQAFPLREIQRKFRRRRLH
jgi:hypothetical protein